MPNNQLYPAFAKGTSYYPSGYYGSGIHFNNQGTNAGATTFFLTSGSLPNFYAGMENPSIAYGSQQAQADTTSPTYSNNMTNSTAIGGAVKFSILWNDDTSLNPNGQYIFSTK
jgi:hypothetical protein